MRFHFKGTLVLLIVCLALGGYVYFYEIKGGEKREKAKEAEKQVWKFEGSDIELVRAVRFSDAKLATKLQPKPPSGVQSK